MSFLNIIESALDDLSSLQVATLYGSAITISNGLDAATKADLESKIATADTSVANARVAWLGATTPSERIELHRAYRAAKGRLRELQEALYEVNPSDIFAKIQLSLGSAKTAGYSRLQLGGDSTHYFDANLAQEQAFLIEAHQANVQAAQEARQKLVETTIGLLKIGQMI